MNAVELDPIIYTEVTPLKVKLWKLNWTRKAKIEVTKRKIIHLNRLQKLGKKSKRREERIQGVRWRFWWEDCVLTEIIILGGSSSEEGVKVELKIWSAQWVHQYFSQARMVTKFVILYTVSPENWIHLTAGRLASLLWKIVEEDAMGTIREWEEVGRLFPYRYVGSKQGVPFHAPAHC